MILTNCSVPINLERIQNIGKDCFVSPVVITMEKDRSVKTAEDSRRLNLGSINMSLHMKNYWSKIYRSNEGTERAILEIKERPLVSIWPWESLPKKNQRDNVVLHKREKNERTLQIQMIVFWLVRYLNIILSNYLTDIQTTKHQRIKQKKSSNMGRSSKTTYRTVYKAVNFPSNK